MDVLIIEDSSMEGMTLARIAESLGHRAKLVASAEEALRLLSERTPDIVITDLEMPGLSGEVLVSRLRALDLDHYVYVIMRTVHNNERVIASAFAAGVDDFIAKSRNLDELKARIRAGERIVSLETKLRSRVKELESALRRLELTAKMSGAAAVEKVAILGLSAPPPAAPAGRASAPKREGIAALPAWQSLAATLGKVFSDFVQTSFEEVEGDPRLLRDAMATAITLTDVAHDLEIGITLMGDPAMVRSLAEALFGEVDEDTLNDFFAELANIAMGVTKSAFVKDGHSFTGGLPRRLASPSVDTIFSPYNVKECWAFENAGQRIYALVGSRKKGRIRIEVQRLREGMVIAEDLMNNGVLLIRAGTRITESIAERLTKMVPRAQVELTDPGAG